MQDDLAAKMRSIQPYLIGLWRFKEHGLPLKWCATFSWKGEYFDVQMHDTPLDAVKAVKRKVKELKTKGKPKWKSRQMIMVSRS